MPPKLLRPRLLLLLAPVCALAVHAQDGDAVESFRRGKALIARGSSRADPAPLEEAKSLFVELANQPQLAAQARYFAGLAYYRLFELAQREGQSRKQLEIHLDHAINQLAEVTKLDERIAGAHALLAINLAYKVAYYPSSVDLVAPQAREMIKKAKELAPDDPRVALLEGHGMYRMPEIFEGDAERALAAFEHAARSFESEKAGAAFDPDWGHAEVHACIGQLHLEQGNAQKAEKALRKALKIDSEYAWVKNELLPQLDEADADGSR